MRNELGATSSRQLKLWTFQSIVVNFIPSYFFYTPIICFAQEDYYTLSKNGDKFPRPVYYLHQTDFETIKKISRKKTVFLSKKNKFIHISDKHRFCILNKKEVRNIEFTKPELLYKFEKQEFNEKADRVKKENGFRPPPPIKHFILKILVLTKEKNSYYLYEVDWL